MNGPLAQIIKRIGDDVVERLAAAGYPPLVNGTIDVGRVEQFAQGSPPRIIFTPTASKFSMRDVFSSSYSAMSDERREQKVQRAIESEDFTFEVTCWGAAVADDGDPPPTVIDDHDVTRALYHAVRASVQSLAQGSYAVSSQGEWLIASFDASQILVSGAAFKFSLTLMTPVLSTLVPYDRGRQYAPSDVRAKITDSLTLPNGQNEAGCEAP